jgi:hypothetical protein
MRFTIRAFSFVVLVAGGILSGASAQTGGSLGDIQLKLRQQYTFAKTTEDNKDLSEAGTVLVLHKDRFLMYPTAAVAPALNVYKDGTLKVGQMRELQVYGHLQESGLTPQTFRKFFLAGEKFFVTSIDAESDGFVLTLYSDPVNNVRYYGQLKIQFQKHIVPPADDVLRQVQEVLTPDTSSGAAPAAYVPPAQASAPGGGPTPGAKAQMTPSSLEVGGKSYSVTERQSGRAGHMVILTGPDGTAMVSVSNNNEIIRYISPPNGIAPNGNDYKPLINQVWAAYLAQKDGTASGGTTPGNLPADSTAPAPAPAQDSSVAPLPVPPLPVPPPPPAEPKTVAIGQTEDQVVAALGPPATIVDKKAAGKTFIYKDMKVYFKLGKVVDIQ